jgi:hypothetical protein
MRILPHILKKKKTAQDLGGFWYNIQTFFIKGVSKCPQQKLS